ncbi:MAG: hypothetical protein ABIT20_09060 [Gemmatimonadaceae bacterium]
MREFTDSRGVEWRVWAVTPAHMHPITRGEDYMDKLQDGWLAFESASEKRRLETPYPTDWQTAPLAQLELLCRRASPAPKRKAATPTSQRRAISAVEIEREAEANANARRTFMSPGGRTWTVRVHECLDRKGAAQTVLRFTAGDLVLELLEWPENWRDLSVIEYAVLLLDAEPPRRSVAGDGPQRRLDDREP